MDDLTRRTEPDCNDAEQPESASPENSGTRTSGDARDSSPSSPRGGLAKRYADQSNSRPLSGQASPETLQAQTHEESGRPSARSAKDVKERIKKEGGEPRRLGNLAQREAQLHEKSACESALAGSMESLADAKLLGRQLASTTGVIGNSHLDKKARRESYRLYAALDAEDAEDSILTRQLVAVNNVTMACFERALRSGNPQVQAINLRHGLKGIDAITKLIDLRDRRRREVGATVKVGDVNVEAGGQAVVGSVKVKGRGSKSKKKKSGRGSNGETRG